MIVNEDEPGRIWEGDSGKKTCLEAGRSSSDSATIFRALLPLEASAFLGNAYKTLLDALKIRGHDSHVELGVLSSGTEQERLNSAGELAQLLLDTLEIEHITYQ